MKLYFSIFFLILATNLFAQSIVLDFDLVDSVIVSNREIKIEDIRDGFENISGVSTSNDAVYLEKNADAQIKFRNTFLGNTKFFSMLRSVKGGGDGGGG